jgi:hypothetical protein
MGQHRIFCSCATKEESGRRGRAHDVLLRKRENNAKTEKEEIGMEIETENNDDDDDGDDDFHCIKEAISAASKHNGQQQQHQRSVLTLSADELWEAMTNLGEIADDNDNDTNITNKNNMNESS